MREILIYGAGKCGKRALGFIRQNFQNYVVVGFVDSKVQKQLYCELPVYDGNSYDFSNMNVVIAVYDPWNQIDIYEFLRRKNPKKIFRFWIEKHGYTQEEEEIFDDCSEWGDCILDYAEMHAVDFCNLNCKGCSHFSPLFERKFPNINSRLADVSKLASIFSHIIDFRLMGGEPLLNPQLIDYIFGVRKILPSTNCYLVTNGLLIPFVDKEIWKAVKDNNFIVSITEYEPTMKYKEKICSLFDEYDIKYQVAPYSYDKMFNKPLAYSCESKLNKICIAKRCINICDGKIARCPSLMYIDSLNKAFGVEFPRNGILDLQDYDDGMTLRNELRKRVPLCNYCVENAVEWSTCSKQPMLIDFVEEDK